MATSSPDPEARAARNQAMLRELNERIVEREARAARNHAMLRELNERIVELTKVFGEFDALQIACECADASCTQLLSIDGEAYAAVRRSPRTFVVLPDHVLWEDERVISRDTRYAVVELLRKEGEVGEATPAPVLPD